MTAVLSLLFELLGGGLENAIALSGSPSGVTALAAIALAGLFLTLTVLVRSDPALSAVLNPVAVRRRAEQTVFLPLCDPGADGRPRPRAPSAHHRAA